MKTIRWQLAGVLCAWLIGAVAQAQQPPYTPVYPAPAPIPGTGDAPSTANTNAVAPGGVLSDWLLYNGGATAVRRDCCFGIPAIYTPLFTELYLRAGPSVPLGGESLSRELKTGWSFMGGGRALFFNAEQTAAWTVDVHIVNTNESGGALNTHFPVNIVSQGVSTHFGTNGIPGVTVQDSNRTMVGLGVGREWYLWKPANSPDCHWRFGVDGGGRYGSHELELVQTHHLTDVITGVYASVHSDLEVPCGKAIFFGGLRLEGAQTFSDVLQQASNVFDLTVYLNIGIRF